MYDVGKLKAIIYSLVIGTIIGTVGTSWVLSRYNDPGSTIQDLNAELNNIKGQLETSKQLNTELTTENTKYADYERRYNAVSDEFRKYQQRVKSELELGQKEIGGILGYQRGAIHSLDDSIRILEEVGRANGIITE